MTRTLLTAIFLTLFSQTAWSEAGMCRLLKFKEFESKCEEGDSLHWLGSNGLKPQVVLNYCNLDKQVFQWQHDYVSPPTHGDQTFSEIICVYQKKVDRPPIKP